MQTHQPSTLLGILFFLVYAAISVIIGIRASRKETEEEFMIAGRRVHGILMMATMAAGWFDGVTLSVYLAYVYQYGFAAISLFVGIACGFLLFRRFARRVKKAADELRVYSMPEYFYRLLGKRNGVLFSVFLLTQFFGYLVINFILSGKVLSHLFPFLGYTLAVVIGGLIILTYLLLAGFQAVVRTDFYQLVIMIVMTLLAFGFFIERVTITSAEFDLGRMGAGNIIGFFVLAAFGVMVAPDIWQRVFAARDETALKNGFAYTAIILPLLAVIIAVVGFATKQSLQGIAPEDALVKAFDTLLPFGITEFAMVLLYAVSLSSSDTATFVVSSIVTRDLNNYSATFSEESMRKLTRIIMIAFVTLAVLIATTYQQIIHIALALGSLNIALFPVVFGSLFWKLKPAAVFWSLIVVLATVLGLAFMRSLDPQSAALSLPVGLVFLVLFQILFRKSAATESAPGARNL